MQKKLDAGLWALKGNNFFMFKSLLTKGKIYTFSFKIEIKNTFYWQFLRLIRPTNLMLF